MGGRQRRSEVVSESMYARMRQMRHQGARLSDIGAQFNMHRGTVQNILNGNLRTLASRRTDPATHLRSKKTLEQCLAQCEPNANIESLCQIVGLVTNPIQDPIGRCNNCGTDVTLPCVRCKSVEYLKNGGLKVSQLIPQMEDDTWEGL